jgi:hypothetical protein
MRIKFELKREEIGGKGMHNVEIHNLCCSSDTGLSKNSGKMV